MFGRRKAQPKEEPLQPEPLQGNEEMSGERPAYWHGDKLVTLPAGLGGAVEELPISPYTGQPYNPAWAVKKSDNPLLNRPPNPALDIVYRRH